MQQRIETGLPFYRTLPSKRWGSKQLKDQAEFVFEIAQKAVNEIVEMRKHYRKWLSLEVKMALRLTDWRELGEIMKKKADNTGQDGFISQSEIPLRKVPAAEKMKARLEDISPLTLEDAKNFILWSGEIVKQAREEDWEFANCPEGDRQGSPTWLHYKIRKLATLMSYLLQMQNLVEDCRFTEAYKYCEDISSFGTKAGKILSGSKNPGTDSDEPARGMDRKFERLKRLMYIWHGQEKGILPPEQKPS